ncbi:MAG: ATP-binding protein [Gammaproteobacteria bacterium]|nr:ATP-binding protein [Gammaproteobacteria bacterium]
MKRFLNRIIESGVLPTDSEDLRLKKVALTLVPLIIGPAAFIWGMIYILLGHPLSGSIPMSYAIISAFSLIYFFKTKRTRFIQYSQLLLVLILPFLLMWSLGGFAAGSMVMIWAIYAPIAALMFLEKRAALFWFLAYFGLIVMSVLLDGFLVEAVTPLPELAREIFYLLNMGSGSAGLYLLVSYSIIEQKRAIEHLKDKQIHLQENTAKLNQEMAERKIADAQIYSLNERLRLATESAGIGIWDWNILNNDGRWDKVQYQLYGLQAPAEPDSFAVIYEGWQKALHPDDLNSASEETSTALSGNAPYNSEFRVIWPNGETHWLKSIATVYRNTAGEPVRMLGITMDVTSIKQSEQVLIAARDEADHANKAKSEFLSSMSHELRTPMNAILGFGQLLDFDPAMSEENRDQVHEILKAGQHLLNLINEILDLSRIESGRLELSLEPVEIAPIITECLELVTTLANKRNITITHNISSSATVRADRLRLKQVILNLLSNAIKYNHKGGKVTLEVQAEGTDRQRILVSDTGKGIASEHFDKLFLPFNRLDADNSNIEGTGIGLTITRRIIETMGGTVDVKSEVNVGSTFWIDLPIDSLPDAMHEHNTVNKAFDSSTLRSNPDTIQHLVLYIEDNPANLKLVTQILDRRPHIQLLTAHTPELGIELARTRHPRLILLDINMPNMDGYQVMQIFKADEHLKTIPVIAITANAMPRDIERGMAAGFSDYLTKPLDVERFHAVVDKLLSSQTTMTGTLS